VALIAVDKLSKSGMMGVIAKEIATMRRQRITIEVEELPNGAFHWYLFGSTGKPVTDSTKFGDKVPFSSAETDLRGASNAAHQLLWIERSCLA
jgi:hypothetical protein